VAPKIKASPTGLYLPVFPASRDVFLFLSLSLNRQTRFSDHLIPSNDYRASMRHQSKQLLPI